MKRIAIAVLCVLLLATVGATAAAAPAGNSAVRQFDVTSGPVSGTLTIDTAAHTFVFNGKGGTPGTTYYLYTSLATAPLGSGVADSNGNLHIEGTCTATTAQLDTATVTVTVNAAGAGEGYYTQIYGFSLYNSGGFVVRLACYYSTDGGVTWRESGHTKGVAIGNIAYAGPLSDLGVPSGALVKILAIVVGGKDTTDNYVWHYVNGYYSGKLYYAQYQIRGTTLKPKLEYYDWTPIR